MNNRHLGAAMIAVALAAAAIAGFVLYGLLSSGPAPETADAGAPTAPTSPLRDRPSLPVDRADAELAGRVVDSAGAPIPDVQLTARAESIDAARRGVDAGPGPVPDAAVVARTDGDGRFALGGIGSGHVRLELEGDAVITAEVRFVAVPQRGLEIVASRAVSIAGQVSGDGAGAGVVVTAVGESARGTATTDATGTFAIGDLPEGVYRVFAASGERGSPAVRVERRGAGPFTPVALALAPAAIISGRLVDAETNAPLAGTVVLTHGGDEPQRQGEAGADGRFAIEGVPPGRWYAEAASPGYVGADSLAFAADNSRSITLVLSRGGSVAGQVVDPDGRPVSGALVEAAGEGPGARRRAPPVIAAAGDGFIPRGELGVMTGPIPLVPSQPVSAARIAEPVAAGGAAPVDAGGSQRLTDAGGRFRLVGLEPGSYRLLASHPDYAGGASAPFSIALGASRENLEVVMARGVRISGVVVDDRGAPLVAARVTATSSGPMPLRTHTDSAGRFTLPPLSGATTLSASAAGFATATRTIANPGTDEIEIALVRANDSIGGSVADASGFPLRGARLTVEGHPAAAAVADDGGRFELRNLPSGTFTVTVEHADYPEHRVELSTGLGREIEVPLGGGLSGLVIDTDSRRPIAAKVVIEGAGVTRATSDPVTVDSADGRFERAPVAAGSYVIRASAPGYAPASTTAEVKAGSRPKEITTRDILLELARGASISGTVRDENGERVVGAVVRAGEREIKTDIDGRFSLADVPAVRDLEVAARKGDRRGAVKLSLAPGDELTTVEIAIGP